MAGKRKIALSDGSKKAIRVIYKKYVVGDKKGEELESDDEED